MSASLPTTVCPCCGLKLLFEREGDRAESQYNFTEWAKLCKRPELQSAALCFALAGQGQCTGNTHTHANTDEETP